MALNSSDVNAGDDILAAHNNNLIDDIEQHDHDGSDTAKLNVGVEFASAVTRDHSISCCAFIGATETTNWNLGSGGTSIASGDSGAITIFAPVFLPHGAVVTAFTVEWFRDDAAAAGDADLYRYGRGIGASLMAVADSDSSSGGHSVTDSSIADATIDNNSFHYFIKVIINPNDNANDVYLYNAYITYTIVKPLP